MSKTIAMTQYAKDGSAVHVHVLDDETMVAAMDAEGTILTQQDGMRTEERPTGAMTILERSEDGSPTTVMPETETVEVPNIVPVLKPQQTTYSFAAMPPYQWGHVPIPDTTPQEFTKPGPPMTIDLYVAQCEAEVQALLDAEAAQAELVEVKHA